MKRRGDDIFASQLMSSKIKRGKRKENGFSICKQESVCSLSSVSGKCVFAPSAAWALFSTRHYPLGL